MQQTSPNICIFPSAPERAQRSPWRFIGGDHPHDERAELRFSAAGISNGEIIPLHDVCVSRARGRERGREGESIHPQRYRCLLFLKEGRGVQRRHCAERYSCMCRQEAPTTPLLESSERIMCGVGAASFSAGFLPRICRPKFRRRESERYEWGCWAPSHAFVSYRDNT